MSNLKIYKSPTDLNVPPLLKFKLNIATVTLFQRGQHCCFLMLDLWSLFFWKG